MKVIIKNTRENNFILILMLLLCGALGKFMQLYYLPAKYLFDGRRILSEVKSGYRSGDRGYDTTEDFFSLLMKFIPLDTFEQWSIFLGAIGTLMIAFVIYQSFKKKMTILEMILVLSSVVLANIYLFTVSKEFFQLILLMPAIIALQKSRRYTIQKYVMYVSLFLVSILLRTYFMIILLLFLLLIKLFNLDSLKAKKIMRWVVGLIIVGLIGLTVMYYIKPDLYHTLIGARYSVNKFRENDVNANTIIYDLFPSSNPFLFTINLAINLVRLLFPIELITKGTGQIIFMIYQIILTGYLIYGALELLRSKKQNSQQIALIFMIAFLIVSAIFEPDFGSFCRHEIGMVFISYIAIGRGHEYEKEKNNFFG